MGYETYCTLYHSYILPVANYGVAVWGFKECWAPQVLQNKIMRFFLGVHRFAPLPMLWTEMDWVNIGKTRWIEMLRYMNRLATMDESCIPKQILRWEIQEGCIAWMGEILQICSFWGLPSPIGPFQTFYVFYLDPVERKALTTCRSEWESAARKMPKLDTYNLVKDFTEPGTLVRANIHRGQRSILSRLLGGILPLEIETGRFGKNRKKRELRFCKLCGKEEVEDELHFLFTCDALKDVREQTISVLSNSIMDTDSFSKAEQLAKLLTKDHIKEFAQALETHFYARRDLVYKPSE